MTTWSGRTRAILVLGGIAALGLVLALTGAIVNAASSSDDGESAAKEQVISRANDFAVAYNTYDVAHLADYQERLKGLLTPSYDKQFVQVTNAIFNALKDKKQKSGDPKVLAIAVDDIDKDSAEALVAVDASITNTDNAASVLRHFRWKVSFTKSKGEWRVSNYEVVAAVAASAGTPTPSATPTDGGN
ncbi:MAG: Mce-associated rane protein [Nocardioidaceae bacterium]|nr:Mce-associated rane protein [Nocardioidaceae bacterium]